MATIGMNNVHVALVTDDPIVGLTTYAPVVKIAGAISGNINPNTSSATLFADDGPFESATTMGEVEVELNMADLSLEHQALLFGQSYANGMIKATSNDQPPYLALGFSALRSDGGYEYVWLAKGKFGLAQDEYATKGDSVEFTTPTITGAFVKRISDGEWRRKTKESDPNFDFSYVATWFTSPLTPKGAKAQANWGGVTTAPLLRAAGIPAAAGIAITFNRKTGSPGDETATWTGNNLAVALVDGVTYSSDAIIGLINTASGTKPAAGSSLVFRISANITPAAGDTATTLTLAM